MFECLDILVEFCGEQKKMFRQIHDRLILSCSKWRPYFRNNSVCRMCIPLLAVLKKKHSAFSS